MDRTLEALLVFEFKHTEERHCDEANKILVLALVAFGLSAIAWKSEVKIAVASSAPSASALQPAQQAAPTLASVIDGEISGIEKEIVDAAEAMPEDRFNFSPENLKIPGSEYKGVRTFALQVKHVAFRIITFGRRLQGTSCRKVGRTENGPENLKSKAEIIAFLKDSFALGHKAAATLTAENMLQNAQHSKSTRLRLATFGVAHACDHYGQMVEYLRMNGIVPPASR